jgi:hypothetical protein
MVVDNSRKVKSNISSLLEFSVAPSYLGVRRSCRRFRDGMISLDTFTRLRSAFWTWGFLLFECASSRALARDLDTLRPDLNFLRNGVRISTEN